MKALLRKIRQILRDRRVRRFFTRVVSTLAAIVVFVTTYALVLPAITLERVAACGIEEHQHTDDCWSEVLICDIPESDGHEHNDDCYSETRELVCEIPEHVHSVENGCYDEDGNLVCSEVEHTHGDGCYKEVRTLTCKIPESEGHHHDSSCYEKVLTCGKEYHVHSAACYKDDAANSGSTESAAVAASTGSAAMEDESGSASTGASTGAATGATSGASTVGVNADEAATAATTNVLPEELADGVAEDLSTGYVPQLEPVDMDTVLNKHTGFYYFDASKYAEEHAAEDGTVELPANSAEIEDWKEYNEKNDKLEDSDLLRLYLSYTVPAGTLNETNQVSRYRLPSNIRLTDDQIVAINETVNGIAGQYMDMSTLEITNPEKYEFYRGAEAIEGSRTPDVAVNDYLYDLVKAGGSGEEYISAVVKAENVFDEHSGEWVGQDLIFIWTPYSIEKNQNEYDKDGQPTKAGEKITGWFACDFNTAQVEWNDPVVTAEEGEDGTVTTTAEKTTEVVLVNEDKSAGIKEISETLTLVEADVDDQTVEEVTAEETVDDSGKGSTEEAAEGETEEVAADATVDAQREDTSDGEAGEDTAAIEDRTVEDDSVPNTTDAVEDANMEEPIVIMPAMSFKDSIKIRTGKPADIDEGGTVANAAESLPEEAEVTVRVEADEGTFPAGTTMKLRAVDNLDDVAKVVTETVENPAASSDTADAVDSAESKTGNKQSTEEALQDQNEKLEEVETEKPEEQQTVKTDDAETEISETPEKQKTSESDENQNSNLKTYGFQAVDITFVDAEGNEIEPAKPVRVALTSATVEQVKKDAETSAVTDPVVVHVDDEGNAEQMELVAPEEIEPAQGKTEEELFEAVEKAEKADKTSTADTANEAQEDQDGSETSSDATVDNDAADESASSDSTDSSSAMPQTTVDTADVTDTAEQSSTTEEAGQSSAVGFTTDSFSVYAIVYTVDFHYDVDGQTYDYSIKGGDTISLKELLPILHVVTDDAETENVDEVQTFINDIEDVKFSDESLVRVAKIDEDTTAGDLKEKIKNETGVEVAYSKDITDDQLAEMDAKELRTPDWALVSLKAFRSEETLEVAMKSGETFTVFVTDAQVNNTASIVSGNNYYIYTVSDGTAYALSYDGSTSVVDINNPSLGDDYNWKFTKPDNYWIIQNVGHDTHYLDLKSGKISSESATGISIVNRQDSNAGFSMMNWENNGWVYLTLNKNSTPYTYTTTASDSSASRMRLLDAPAASTQTDDPGDPVITPTSPIPNTVDPPTGTKTLVPNKYDGQEDGTYTLSLSVTPHSNPEGNESKKKANVLIVMDRSSSMITKTVNNNTARWYYGHTSTATFRGDIRSGTGYTFYDANGTRLYESWSWAGWSDYTLHYGNSNGPIYTGDIWVESKTTRLKAEQDALNGTEGLFSTLLANNTTSGDGQDTVEIKVISFADERFDDKSFANETESSSWVSGNDASDLERVVSSSRFTSGTNWEEALQYAWDEIKAKKEADGNKEEYYVVFLTDGEPTAIEGNDPNQAPYTNGDNPVDGNIVAYDEAKDEAKQLVDNGIKFYNIFTFRVGEAIKYSIYLTNYAYGNGDYNANDTTDAAKNYFSDAKTIDQLNDKFKDIISSINTVVGHANVVITDMLTTDALTSTTVEGKAGGFVYSVKDKNGIPLYTVTAADNTEDPDHPVVTFHVPNPETNGTDDYPATEKTEDGRTYYEAEIDENTTYKMALADFTNTEGEKTGKIEWDLSALGMLMGGYTYTVSFVVWPDQDAYDYVAALNNKIPSITNSKDETVIVEWDEDNQEIVYEEDGTTIKYYKNGVPEYPSIVKYPNGVFAVLTNTEQKVKYSVIKTETVNGEPQPPVISDPIEFELPTPDPMPLTSTGSRVSKVWNVNRDPDILIKLLYEFNVDGTLVKDSNGNPVPKAVYAFDEDGEPLYDEEENPIKIADGFFVDFIVQQDDSEYKTVRLGWDDEKKEYVWYVPEETDEDEIAKYTKTVTYGEGEDAVTFTIGTKWEQDFSIATGLMLTYDRMVAIGLDPDSGSYPQGEYEDENGTITTYYLLEDGHDYTLTEPGLGYEYDFLAPTYHPMLVDGVMKSVLFTKSDDGKTITISEINDMEISKDNKSMLDVANTLRGYIHLNKVIVEKDGTTLDTADTTEFEYFIELFNDNAPFTEEGNHIPWYGISGLFYHDEEGKYYQAYAIRDETGRPTRNLTLTDEKGVTFSAETSSGDPFNEDVYGPTKVTILIDEDTSETKEIDLYGNQMTPDEETAAAEGEYRKATAVFKITQNQTLNIANVPVNTSYTIIESHKRGYELIKIEKIIQQKKGSDKHETLNDVSTATISGKIVSDRDNNIIYTNKKLPDLEIIKTDGRTVDQETKTYLEGAEFTVTQLNETGTGQYKQKEPDDSGDDEEEPGEPDDPGQGEGTGGTDGSGGNDETGEAEETQSKLYYQKVVTSDADGRILITDLEPGYYEIKETKAPDGYVLTVKPEYIKLINGVITRISKSNDDPGTADVNEGLVENWPSKGNVSTELIRFTQGTYAVADDPETEDEDETKPATNDTFLIGNEPGAELPSAGGSGTKSVYILGGLLTAMSLLLLLDRKRIRT